MNTKVVLNVSKFDAVVVFNYGESVDSPANEAIKKRAEMLHRIYQKAHFLVLSSHDEILFETSVPTAEKSGWKKVLVVSAPSGTKRYKKLLQKKGLCVEVDTYLREVYPKKTWKK